MSAGACDGLAITANGAVFTWGEGECGCLGHGEELSNQLLPIRWSRRGRCGFLGWVSIGTVPGASYGDARRVRGRLGDLASARADRPLRPSEGEREESGGFGSLSHIFCCVLRCRLGLFSRPN